MYANLRTSAKSASSAVCSKWPRQESNLGLELRKLIYYPLYYEAIIEEIFSSKISKSQKSQVKKSKYPILTVTNIRKHPNQQINESTNQLPVTSQNPAHLFQIFSRQLPAKLFRRIFLLQSTHSGPMRAQPISKNLTPKK